MNLVLIGFRAAGKTTVGRRLSAYLRRVFVDSDDMIEKHQGTTIKDIVEGHGWDYFRAIEREVISEVSNDDNLIISAGGGVVIDPKNVNALRKKGFIIWLKADVEVLLRRMAQDHRTMTGRPSLTGKDCLKEFREVLIQREPLYERASEVQVDTSLLDVDGVVHQVLSIFEERLVRV
ncbi:MAG: shikimate kinase [Thermodesulfobacteriota bacterium]|nr:shikimate kinase [Thermodesulfobacteriota bacterium]